MPVEISESQTTEAISVPYPAFISATRSNRGFIDVRGRPELAGEIAEGLSSKRLRAFLIRLAGSRAGLFSIGCDLGHHSDLGAAKGRRRVAGGYVQVASVRYNEVRAGHWARLCNAVSDALRQAAGRDEWDVHFRLSPVMMNLDRYNKITGSVHVAFFAQAKSHQDASRSRERLIAALDHGFSDAAVESAFT